jgi:four helix bundle protein
MAMGRKGKMQAKLPHERLDVYGLYLETASLCSDIVSGAVQQVVAFDHLERAMESIGVNLIRANGQPSGSAQRASYLDVSIASTHECAACLDVCLAKRVMEECMYVSGTRSLWRIRGMLLGLKRASTAQVREDRTSYGTPGFPFANLDMYRVSLRAVRWIHDLLEEITPKVRIQRRLDTSTTGTVLNIAEGHGRETAADQNRFMKTAQEHAYQTLVLLDVMAARKDVTESRIAEGKATQTRVITMLHAWCDSNNRRDPEA